MNAREFVKTVLLKTPKKEKMALLKEALDTDFGLFWSMAEIYLNAPLGEGGGLSTEEIDSVFKTKYP